MREVTLIAGICLAGVTLSGCFADEMPDPVQVQGGHIPWTIPAGEPWVYVSQFCGFCGGQPDFPGLQFTVLYTSGRVLWVQFDRVHWDNGTTLTFEEGLQPYQAAVAHAMDSLRGPYAGSPKKHVNHVAASQVFASEWKDMQAFWADVVPALEEPPPIERRCVHGGGERFVQVLPEFPHAVHVLNRDGGHCGSEGGNYVEGSPWDAVLDQMDQLTAWVIQWPEP